MKMASKLGAALKNKLNVKRVRKSYQNKHVDGSGNFGFVIITKEDEWYRIDGDYNPSGEIYRIDVSAYGTTEDRHIPMIMKIRQALKEIGEK